MKSEYVTSAVSKKTCPEELLPEIVFVGRSNVGKSSLINSLTNRKSLARTCVDERGRRDPERGGRDDARKGRI
ncbi:MAG: 50S ribosome-binding GTPase [Lachnospiraceae bacterium]|nr:50S ribosome-binding GTPase [Lachnospiraceae bacterium]